MAENYSKLMPALKRCLPEAVLTTLGRETAFILRQRTVAAADFVWAVVLSRFAAGIPGFDKARRTFENITGQTIWPRPFQKRFLSTAATDFFAQAFDAAVSAWKKRRRIEHALAKHFTDIVAIDSTIIQLQDGMRRTFPGHMNAAAELKATLAISVFGLVPLMARLTSRKVHDTNLFPALSLFHKGTLLLFDTAYTDYGRLGEIDDAGLHYVAPMRVDGSPWVTEVHRGPKKVKVQVDAAMRRCEEGRRSGIRLPDLLRRKARVGKIWDLDVILYPSEGDPVLARLVILPARKERQAKKSLLRLTNLERTWIAEAVDELYRLRWQIEHVFKELKQDLSLESLPTNDANAVQVLVWASLIALAVSRTVACALTPLSKLNGLAAKHALGVITKTIRSCVASLIRLRTRRPSAVAIEEFLDEIAYASRRGSLSRADSFQRLSSLVPA